MEHIIDRKFHSETPNTKWLTGITEFALLAGKVYLSPIVDCFDGFIVSWTVGTSPNAELVNIMPDIAIAHRKKGDTPTIHTDRGCHYKWPGWAEQWIEPNYSGSMSKKGCSQDNAACEGFFGRLNHHESKKTSAPPCLHIGNKYR